jgi:HlyD family secretion protein
MKYRIFNVIIILTILSGCSKNHDKSDAYGTFESTEIIVSSEVAGKITNLTIDEGQQATTGSVLLQIDNTEWNLKKEQLMAQKNIISSKYANIKSQVDVQDQQKENLMVEKRRLEKLLADNAVPPKQMDDVKASLNIIDKQVKALETQTVSIPSELESLDRQIDQLELNISRCSVTCPITGTILSKYVNKGEVVSPGKPLFKVADLSQMMLRVYVSGNTLPKLKIGQKAEVLVDKGKKDLKNYEGVISWISPNAEFTPKIIQTKEERVNLVYAVKITVKNDGYLKIGMPGEANFKE